MQFTSDHFKVVGSDGVTVSDVRGNGYSCLGASEAFTTDQLGPGQQYVGTVVIDSPVTTGALIYTYPGMTTGWEWQF